MAGVAVLELLELGGAHLLGMPLLCSRLHEAAVRLGDRHLVERVELFLTI